MGATFRIEVEVERGQVEVTLFENDCPVRGHGDSTNTIPARDMVRPLAEYVATAVEAKRRLF